MAGRAGCAGRGLYGAALRRPAEAAVAGGASACGRRARLGDADARWSAAAVAQQEQFLARLSAVGARIAPEYRYTRVVNGFSARLDPTSAALLDDDREVIGIYPVRIAYPLRLPSRAEESFHLPSPISRSRGSTGPV